MEKGTKIALIVGGVLLVGGGITAYYFIRKNKKEDPETINTENGGVKKSPVLASAVKKALGGGVSSSTTYEKQSRANKLIENLNKYNISPSSDLSKYTSEMAKMGYALRYYKDKDKKWYYIPLSGVDSSKVKNGVEIV